MPPHCNLGGEDGVTARSTLTLDSTFSCKPLRSSTPAFWGIQRSTLHGMELTALTRLQ